MQNEITQYYSDKIVFTEEDHRYTYNGVECISATTILGTLEEQFDEDFHSKRIAKKEGVTQDEILARWKAKKDFAGLRGTAIHRYLECRLLGIPYDFDFEIDKEEIQSAENVLYNLHTRGIEPYGVEVIVGNEEHLVCGMVDFVGRFRNTHKNSGQFVISDWKTNKGKDLINGGRFDSPLKAPLWHLKNSKNTMYSLQLSLYDYVLCQEFDWWEGAIHKELYHIDGAKAMHIPLQDYKPSIGFVFQERLKQLKGAN